MKFFSTIAGLMLATTSVFAQTDANYPLAPSCQEGTVLHCFCWTYNQIKEELPNIAAAGFTSVQTSPAQDAGSGAWYWAYQPYDFACTGNALGTPEELAALCSEADKYGVKIVVDIVANHLNGSMNYVASRWQDDQYWHDYTGDIDYTNRWQITHGKIGMRDINSENATVQQAVLDYVLYLKSLGVSGLRWDAAKHIGLPSEDCDFWKTVTTDTGLWNYGEILVGPTDNGSTDDLMAEYTNYISVTDNQYGRDMRYKFQGGSVTTSSGNWIFRGISPRKTLYWPESHDTYSNDGAYGEDSRSASQNAVDRTYALLAARNGSTVLYFSRPSSTVKANILLGQKGSTHFTADEVMWVNRFHNLMNGRSDYYSYGSDAMSVTRKGGGAVVVKASGSGSVTAPNGGGYVAAGTYTDKISGNTFTVTSSSITGSVGDSGIAVLIPDTLSDTDGDNGDSGDNGDNSDNGDNNGDSNSGDATFTVYFDNSSTSWPTPSIWAWNGGTNYTGGNWPGKEMTLVDGITNIYTWSTTQGTPQYVIFSGMVGEDRKQTGNLVAKNGYLYNADGPVGLYNSDNGDSNGNGDNSDNDNSKVYVYFKDKSRSWNPVYCYIYARSSSSSGMRKVVENSTWPGNVMTYDGCLITESGEKGLWCYEVPDNLTYGYVLFSNGKSGDEAEQYPANTGLQLNGSSMSYINGSWSSTENPTSVPSIALSDTLSEARYFNLQGLQITNPTRGELYIRVLPGGQASKVIL